MNQEETLRTDAQECTSRDFFEPGFTHRVIDSLPDYIPDELKERLKETHTDPQIEYVEDFPKEDETDTFRILIPQKYKESVEESRAYIQGIVMLGEIVTDTLMLETKSDSPSKQGYKGSYDQPIEDLWGVDENKDRIVGLFEHLHIAMLSGDWTEANYYLRENYNIDDIHELAYQIGSTAINTVEQLNQPQKRVFSPFQRSYRISGIYRFSDEKIYISNGADKFAKKLENTVVFSGIFSLLLLGKSMIDLYHMNVSTAILNVSIGTITPLFAMYAIDKRRRILKLSKNLNLECLYTHEVLHHIASDKSNNRHGLCHGEE